MYSTINVEWPSGGAFRPFYALCTSTGCRRHWYLFCRTGVSGAYGNYSKGEGDFSYDWSSIYMDIAETLLIIAFFSIIIFQLADRDGRNGWLWAGANVAAAMLLAQLTSLGSIAVYLAFIATLITLIWSKPLKRKK
jgi:hypothetical protein